jgi:hypothetical protein
MTRSSPAIPLPGITLRDVRLAYLLDTEYKDKRYAEKVEPLGQAPDDYRPTWGQLAYAMSRCGEEPNGRRDWAIGKLRRREQGSKEGKVLE